MSSLSQLKSLFIVALPLLGLVTDARVLRRDTGQQVEETVIDPATNPGKAILWNPDGGPTYKDVAQGSIGDCWLAASMASMAYANPTHLESIMNDPHKDNGKVTVNLWAKDTSVSYNIKKWTITDASTKGTDAAPYVTGGTWVWPNTVQSAFQELAKDHTETGMNIKLDGGTAQQAFLAISGTGPEITYLQTSNTADDDLWAVWNQVKTRPAVCASQSSTGQNMDNGLPGGHAYSAIDCDQDNDTVTLRNPWGKVSSDPTWGTSNGGGKGVTDKGDGVFEISFSDFKKYFVDITAIDAC